MKITLNLFFLHVQSYLTFPTNTVNSCPRNTYYRIQTLKEPNQSRRLKPLTHSTALSTLCFCIYFTYQGDSKLFG